MDLGLQAKLLRVLQEREVERLGGSKLIKLDVRVLATSNRDMRETVNVGQFREDLFYRLNVFPLHISSLQERTEDIVPLAISLLERHAKHAGRAIPALSDEAKQMLKNHSWSGNVRELDNVVQRCLIMQTDEIIQDSDVIFENAAPSMNQAAPNSTQSDEDTDSLNSDLKQREWEIILNTIKSEGGSRKATAERLGISQRTLRYKLARMRDAGISVPGSYGMETA